jgi:hypothetical protein
MTRARTWFLYCIHTLFSDPEASIALEATAGAAAKGQAKMVRKFGAFAHRDVFKPPKNGANHLCHKNDVIA